MTFVIRIQFIGRELKKQAVLPKTDILFPYAVREKMFLVN